jgi:NAD(P)-dependent dehydrogenase (short-subunit alcohol dehydrogenase family)
VTASPTSSPQRTALVTGGSKGIGLAVAHRLAASGHHVALCARDESALTEAAAAVSRSAGRSVDTVSADLSTAEGAEQAMSKARDVLGAVDILVNVAGAAPPGMIDVLTDEQWDTAIDLKLRGYIRLIRGMLPDMVDRGFGRIVNIAGNAGKQPDGWLVTSGVVNAAVIALTKAVGTTVAASGVTVNAVCPGPTETARWAGMQRAYAAMNQVTETQAEAQILAAIPAGRVATTKEIAHAVAFFVSEDAGHITGEALMVDGGHVKGI